MWDRATVFSFGTETEKLPDRRRKQFGRCKEGRYRLEPFLKFRGVKRLDYVWVTHGDVDHLNAVEELLNGESMSRNPVSDFSGTEILG